MKKLNNNNLDVYMYIKEFIRENGYVPTYREVRDGTNYKSLASVKETIEKLAELGFIKVKMNENGNIIVRSIKIVDNKEVQEQIKELRGLYEN